MNSANELPQLASDLFVNAYPETLPFWEAAERGVFLAKKCGACNQLHWYPRVICPLCGSDQTGWQEISGKGTIYSFSKIEKTAQPYVLAWIRLQEGPIVITNIVDTDFNCINIGDEVESRFRRTTHGRLCPVFVRTAPSR